MKIKKLAEELRIRLRSLQSPSILRAMDDEELIWSYLKCQCGLRYVDVMLPYVERASDGDDFAMLSNVLGTLHQIKTHGADCAFRGHPDHGGVRVTAIDLQSEVDRWLAGETWEEIIQYSYE